MQAQDGRVFVAVQPCRIVDTREAGGEIPKNNFRNFRVSGTEEQLATQGGKTDCLDPKAGAGLKPLAISAYIITILAAAAVTIDNTTPAVGDTLTTSNTLSDKNVQGRITYLWLRNGVLTGNTGTTYTITRSDVGNIISVRGSYIDGQGTLKVVESADTAAVSNVNDKSTGNSPAGSLTAYPSNQLPPPIGAGSTVNFAPQRTTGNTTSITLCNPKGSCPANGEFAVLARNSNQHVVIDVRGYFYPPALLTTQTFGKCPDSAPARYVDNGDGTICDSETGLMWEMKNASDGTQDLTNPHDVDNRYSWTSPGDGDNTNPDGTVFTDFLDWPRNVDGYGSGYFVGSSAYTDWRLPTIDELETILNCNDNYSPRIDPIFGPTAIPYYWSSSPSFTDISKARVISFGYCRHSVSSKSTANHVRAVRGGR